MFSHVMIGTNDLEKAKSFYDALLGTLGVPPGRVDRHRIFYRTKTGTFSVTKPIDGKPATPANGGTIGFTAETPEAAAAFHAAGVAQGGTPCEDPPGIREGAGMKLISPTCGTPMATSSARCIGCREGGCLATRVCLNGSSLRTQGPDNRRRLLERKVANTLPNRDAAAYGSRVRGDDPLKG